MMVLRTIRLRKVLLLFVFAFSWLTQAQFHNTQKDILDVVKYRFHIQLSDSNNVIVVKAEEAILLKKKVDSIFLQLKNLNTVGKGMEVSSLVNQFGRRLKYKHENDKIVIYNPGDWIPNELLKLQIQYAGVPEDGMYISNNKFNKRTFFGDNWPNRAQYWLPVIDHPSDKALVEFFITAPSHYEIIASGELVSKEAQDNNSNYYHFKTREPLPTKVMVLGAADFKIKQLDTINGIPVSSWIYKETTDSAFEDYRPAVDVLKYYNSLLGVFPYEKLANVQSKTKFGGMENAGNIFYYEESANGKNQVEALVAHEMAHQWFGDSVTEKEWRDIWLSEGFATYLTNVYLEYKYGKEKLRERMQMEREKVIKYAAYKNVQPIVYDENENLFKLLNRNSYEKGAWVLHMLRNKIGDKSFFEALRTFYQQYKNQNADTNDFIKLVEKISNKDLSDFFNQWLYKASIPTIDLDWKILNNQLIIDVEQLYDNFQFSLPIVLKEDNNIYNLTLQINNQKNHFEFPVPSNAKDVEVIIDPDVVLLFQIEKEH